MLPVVNAPPIVIEPVSILPPKVWAAAAVVPFIELDASVCPDGTVKPAFAVISPDAVIVVPDIAPVDVIAPQPIPPLPNAKDAPVITPAELIDADGVVVAFL